MTAQKFLFGFEVFVDHRSHFSFPQMKIPCCFLQQTTTSSLVCVGGLYVLTVFVVVGFHQGN